MPPAPAPFPKIELHLHLEGAAPPALTRDEAARQGLSSEGLFDASGGYAWKDFSDFLAAYDRVAALYASPEAARALAEAVLRDCAAHGVIYAELAISSDLACDNDPGAWQAYLAALAEGAAAARAATGIEAGFVATVIRHLGPERARQTARLAVEAHHPMIRALGMAGDERIFSPHEFAYAYDQAREAGLGLTAHAGEAAGPQSVRDCLDALKVGRIDHGFRAVEDPALVARLIDERVHLAMTPGSNIALGYVPDWRAHPVAQFRMLGASVSVSTDDPPFFATDMTREFEALRSAFGWSEPDFAAIARDALAAAFCDETLRADLAARLAQ